MAEPVEAAPSLTITGIGTQVDVFVDGEGRAEVRRSTRPSLAPLRTTPQRHPGPSQRLSGPRQCCPGLEPGSLPNHRRARHGPVGPRPHGSHRERHRSGQRDGGNHSSHHPFLGRGPDRQVAHVPRRSRLPPTTGEAWCTPGPVVPARPPSAGSSAPTTPHSHRGRFRPRRRLLSSLPDTPRRLRRTLHRLTVLARSSPSATPAVMHQPWAEAVHE